MATIIDGPARFQVVAHQTCGYDAFRFGGTPDPYANTTPNSRQAQLEHTTVTMENVSQPASAFPLSLEEIERLVKTLYDPGHAKKIPETEATLRVLQRSPQGWEIGDALLNSNDENVRFFGALTFTIKLNSDS